ncbi:MAG: ROK family protein [Clostridiales bacterium]|nr:ROK family protein [Clostridiales bacterium]
MYCLGFDIGGTKCAVSLGFVDRDVCRVLGKRKFPTPEGCAAALKAMTEQADALLEEAELRPGQLAGIGVSCGGPLDSKSGVILSPPNLPGWDHVEITELLRRRYGVPAYLQNDANACAVAEWRFGAGRGCENMIFLTFGTGLGAGLILGGRLYAGTNDMAGEAGHIRMERFGPVGYGKCGSMEGFCSGGGIAQLARYMAIEQIQRGTPPAICESARELDALTAKVVADAAAEGDPFGIAVYRRCGEYLGKGLAILVDLLNPEKIVIGSIYARCRELLYDAMMQTLSEEALPGALAVCSVVPAELGESIGDYAALSVAAGGL